MGIDENNGSVPQIICTHFDCKLENSSSFLVTGSLIQKGERLLPISVKIFIYLFILGQVAKKYNNYKIMSEIGSYISLHFGYNVTCQFLKELELKFNEQEFKKPLNVFLF